jgi:hypothetical protein
MIDDCPPGLLAPMQLAGRTLIRARLADRDGYAAAGAAFAGAIGALRVHGTPYHLADGLLDHAGYLTRLGDAEAAETAISEARDIAGCLSGQPLPDRGAPACRPQNCGSGPDGDGTRPGGIRRRAGWVSGWSGRIETSWLSRAPAR